tara:strand:- start:253 stop:735 length:483 start_codon:yes stop_codon:yes gene_type:complete
MIKIRNELDLTNWFKQNYKKLGFSKIIKFNSSSFPDFIMLEGNKEIRIELEMKSSNFILHKHPINEVDRVICVTEDQKLPIPTIIIPDVEKIEFNQKAPYSLKELILPLFKGELVLTTIEISKKLNINRGTAEKALMELTLDNKIERIKKEGINLWLPKD